MSNFEYPIETKDAKSMDIFLKEDIHGQLYDVLWIEKNLLFYQPTAHITFSTRIQT